MAATLIRNGPLTILDYRCQAGPEDAPYPEVHCRHSLSYVRRGSFGCHVRGRHHQLLAGGFLVGQPGDEFTCTHEHHHGGDECLSIQLGPELLAESGTGPDLWRIGSLAPHAGLAALAERAQAALRGGSELDVAECALVLVHRFLQLESGAPRLRAARPPLRRRVCRAADWIDANSAREVDLLDAAREAGLSPFHFLRSFHAVLGLTPHQHLVRCRLRKAAARLLASEATITVVAQDVGFGDLSNFVTSFRRAAGISPARFRRLPRARLEALRQSLPDRWRALCPPGRA